MSIEIDPTRIVEEAYRLADLGVLDITWVNENGVLKTGKYVVTGFGIDGNENDCLQVTGPYGMNGKNMHRFIIVSSIRQIQISETQSFNRYGAPITKQVRVRRSSDSKKPFASFNDKDIAFLKAVEERGFGK